MGFEPKKMLTTPRSSPVVTHLSTKRAQARLTSQIRRDTVFSRWYDRKLKSLAPCVLFNQDIIIIHFITIYFFISIIFDFSIEVYVIHCDLQFFSINHRVYWIHWLYTSYRAAWVFTPTLCLAWLRITCKRIQSVCCDIICFGFVGYGISRILRGWKCVRDVENWSSIWNIPMK